MIEKGEQWGRPAVGPPDAEVSGSDAALALAVQQHPGACLRFRPDATSDLARELGINADTSGALQVPLDALVTDAGETAVNMIVIGVAPDHLRWWHRAHHVSVRIDDRDFYDGRATTIVIANGQHLRTTDLAPRGHPNDSKAEIQIYDLEPSERPQLRSRLQTGTHLPNPRIATTTARAIEIAIDQRAPVELDGVPRAATKKITVHVLPDAYSLLI